MNVFVIGTGRCGTTTWAKACTHITNYTAGHETRARAWRNRLAYPPDHIEVDHRLAFFLGTLDKTYRDAVYVHLRRDAEATAQSWARRTNAAGMMTLWPRAVFFRPARTAPLALARVMVDTINNDLELFTRGRVTGLTAWIEDPHDVFDEFWDLIGAEGDRAAAHRELDIKWNATGTRKVKVGR